MTIENPTPTETKKQLEPIKRGFLRKLTDQVILCPNGHEFLVRRMSNAHIYNVTAAPWNYKSGRAFGETNVVLLSLFEPGKTYSFTCPHCESTKSFKLTSFVKKTKRELISP